MATGRTIGSVNFIVGMDGQALPAEARASGEEAGLAAAEGFDETFNKRFGSIGDELVANMKKNGELSGQSFSDALANKIIGVKGQLSNELADIFGDTDGLDNYFGKFPSVDEAVDELRGKIGQLSDAGGVSNEEFNRLTGVLDEYIPRARDAAAATQEHQSALRDLGTELDRGVTNFERVDEAFSKHSASLKTITKDTDRVVPSLTKFRSELDKTTESSGNFGGGMSTDAKQIIAIVAIIAGAAPEILSLGSALASSAVIGVGAIGVLVAGIAVLAVGFKELSGDISLLPASIQPAARAFQDLLKPLQAAQDAISVGLFANMAPEFAALGSTITGLTPALQAFATQVGGALQTIIDAINSPAFTSGLQSFLGQAGPIFQTLTDAAVSFGGAIGDLLIGAMPYVSKFADGLAKIGDQFSKWADSDAGRAAITKFFDHGQEIMGPLLDLAGQLADMFGRLVTDQTVSDTATFLNTLQGVIPFIEKLINVLNQANVFQLVADILSTIGQALIPILAVISPILDAVISLVELALQPLGVVLQFVGLLLEPLKIGFQILNDLFVALQPWVTTVYSAFSDLFSAFQAGTDSIMASLKPALDELLDAFVGLLPNPQQLHDVIENQVIPAVQHATTWIKEHLVPAVADIISHITDFINGLGGFDGIEDKLKTAVGYFNTFKNGVNLALNAVLAVINGIITAIDVLGNKKIPNISLNGKGAKVAAHAAGAIVSQPTFITPFDIAGEAGPEAIVPLSGPLSAVNPSVRDLAAYARGEDSGSSGGDQTIHNWEPGSVTVVTPAEDPTIVAETVVDNIIAGL